MKKIFLVISFLFALLNCFSQGKPIPVPRSSKSVTAVDAYVKFSLGMIAPVVPDTTLNGGLDSLGALEYVMRDSSLYMRTISSGLSHKWIRILKVGDAAQSNITSIGISMPAAFTVNNSPLTASGSISVVANGNPTQVILGDGTLGSYIPQLNAIAGPGIQINGSYPNVTFTNTINNTNQLTNGAGFLTATTGNSLYPQLVGNYTNPSWIASIPYSKITGAPVVPAQFNPIAGTNMTITGTYPTYTFNAAGTVYTAATFIKLIGTQFNLDTANYRKVDSVYGVNDSTINVVLNGHTYSIQIKGGTGAGGGGGSGSVTIVTGSNVNGINWSITNPTSIPNLTITLTNITPTTVNGLTLAAQSVGWTIAGGTSSRTLTLAGNATLSGTNTGDVSIGGATYAALSGQTITFSAIDLSGANATGTLAAARFPALTGDVTNIAGNLATTIATHAVTYAKIQQVSALKLVGNPTGSTANMSEIGISTGLIFSGSNILVDSSIYATKYFVTHFPDTIRLFKYGSGIAYLTTSNAGDSLKYKSITSTTTIGWTVNSDSTISANSLLNFQNSLTLSGANVNLVNDVTSPGNNYLYATDGSGVKHWVVYSSLPIATQSVAGLLSAADKTKLDFTQTVVNAGSTDDSVLYSSLTLDTLYAKRFRFTAGNGILISKTGSSQILNVYTFTADTSTGATKLATQAFVLNNATGGGTNIYNSNGSLTGDRQMAGNGHSLSLGLPHDQLTLLTIYSSSNIVLSGNVVYGITSTVDADYSVIGTITQLASITANRNLTLPDPDVFGAGSVLEFVDSNSYNSSFAWQFAGFTVKDPSGNVITQAPNNSVFTLTSVNSVWIISSTSSVSGQTATSGSYTPTFTHTGNVATSTPNICYWQRIGSIVRVSGSIVIVPSSNGLTTGSLSLPIASGLVNPTDLTGCASSTITGFVSTYTSPFVVADVTNDLAALTYTSPTTNGATVFFTFTYIVQ